MESLNAKQIQARLLSLRDEGYRNFTLPLIPGVPEETFIGVRQPAIHQLGKGLDDASKAAFMDDLPHRYHEENLLHAYLISDIKDFGAFLSRIDAFLPRVSNWAVCDSICNKHLNKHKEELIGYVRKWLKSKEPYRVRYAMKCLMNHYLGDSFEPQHLAWVQAVSSVEYYVQMMAAWYLATGLAKNYEPFLQAIEEKRFAPFIHNKAIQKAVESYRISDEHKAYLKTLKIKAG